MSIIGGLGLIASQIVTSKNIKDIHSVVADPSPLYLVVIDSQGMDYKSESFRMAAPTLFRGEAGPGQKIRNSVRV